MARESVIRTARWLWSPAGAATLLGLAFVAISIWWRLYDQTVPNGDEGRHLGYVFFFREQLLDWHELVPFRFEPADGSALYPPLVFVLGALAMMIGGEGVDAPVILLNLVFVPLLVVSCYRVGSIAYGRRAGLLAVAFALAAPMTISLFHLFMLDMATAVMVAGSVWLLIESDRLSHRWFTIAAGVMVGLALMTKQSVALFIVPFGLVLLLRGGWRQWRNLAIFLAVAGVVALPWYIHHLDTLRTVADAATVQASPGADSNAFGTELRRDSAQNYVWYFWNFVNLQFLLPLTLLFVVGVVISALRFIRERAREDYTPELIAGAAGGFFIVAVVFGFQDARYTIPGLIFVAVLGSGWIARLPRIPALLGSVAVFALLFVNTLSVNLGLLGQPIIWVDRDFAPRSVVQEGTLRLFSNFGYLVGPAERNGRLQDLMEAARRDGVTTLGHEPTTPHYLNPSGLSVYGHLADVDVTSDYDAKKLGNRGIFVVYRTPRRSLGKPCARFDDGGGLYVFRGDPGRLDQDHPSLDILKAENLYCPLR